MCLFFSKSCWHLGVTWGSRVSSWELYIMICLITDQEYFERCLLSRCFPVSSAQYLVSKQIPGYPSHVTCHMSLDSPHVSCYHHAWSPANTEHESDLNHDFRDCDQSEHYDHCVFTTKIWETPVSTYRK